MAVLFYKYGDETIRYYMYMNSKDSSLGEKSVDDLIDKYEITTNGHNISVKEYAIKNSEQKDIQPILKIRIFNIKLKAN